MSARRILLVEDNLEFRIVLARMLRQFGFEVDVAADGISALEKFATTPFAMVATDWEMPLLDGQGLIRELRRRAPDLPIVVISGLTFQTPPGADAFLSKAHHTPGTIAAEVDALWRRFFSDSV